MRKQLKQLEQSHKNLDEKLILRLKEIDLTLLKQAEDSEGRDGLILQQNSDISNLYQANEQILENEKSFKVQLDQTEEKMTELQTAVEQALEQIQTEFQAQQAELKETLQGVHSAPQPFEPAGIDSKLDQVIESVNQSSL